MKALWLENQKLSVRDDLSIPQPPQGEALVRVLLAGVCGTDLEMAEGYYPYSGVPGHEFVGEVVTTADESLIGRRVVGEINAVCGRCESCRAGRPTHCTNRTVLGIKGRNGAFAEYLTLPQANLRLVPDSVSTEAAVFVEPLAAALQIQQQVWIRPEDRVLLVGAGRLGQLIAQSLVPTGCGLTVVARYPRQRRLLWEKGISVIPDESVPAAYYDVVIDATGSPSGFGLAVRAVRPRGTLVLKSTYRGEVSADLSSLVVNEITVIGSRCGSFDQALRLLEWGSVDPSALIDAEYPLAQAAEAYERSGQPGALKVLIRP